MTGHRKTIGRKRRASDQNEDRARPLEKNT